MTVWQCPKCGHQQPYRKGHVEAWHYCKPGIPRTYTRLHKIPTTTNNQGRTHANPR